MLSKNPQAQTIDPQGPLGPGPKKSFIMHEFIIYSSDKDYLLSNLQWGFTHIAMCIITH